jgi:CRP-like cAMP-binding protein
LNVKFVFGQGETGDEFYVIESGEVKFSTIKTEGAAPEDIGTCFQNEFFGEGSLLTENPRRATAIANGETVCYSLSGRSFRLIFGKSSD